MREQNDDTAPESPLDVPSDGRPTLKTIAFMTGLGITTVSRALKDAPEIGGETKRRVQLVARQIGYRPNRAGVRLRTGKTNVISLILNTDEQVMGFVSDMIYGISEVLAPTAYHLVVTPYSRNNDPMEPVRYVVETGSADGIIISRTEPDDPRVKYMQDRNFPFVTHGRTRGVPAHAFHDFDNEAFASDAVHALVSSGRRRLSLLAPPLNLTYAGHMRNGFTKALGDTNATEVPFGPVTLDDPIGEIKTRTTALMRTANPPDGIVSGSGGATFAIVAGLEEAGLVLGRDIGVVSKQSSSLLHWFRPQLMVVTENVRLAGEELARALVARISGADPRSLSSLSVPGPPSTARPEEKAASGT